MEWLTKAKHVLAGLLVAGFSLAAQATPIIFTDTYVPGDPVVLSSNGESHTYSHYITLPSPGTNTLETSIDGVLTPGEDYDSTTDSLSDGMISLFFEGVSGPWTNGTFNLFLGGNLLLGTNFALEIPDLAFNVNYITSAGILDVAITRTNAPGTARFVGSELYVSGERITNNLQNPTTPIPSPASITLFGVGLLMLSLLRRRGI